MISLLVTSFPSQTEKEETSNDNIAALSSTNVRKQFNTVVNHYKHLSNINETIDILKDCQGGLKTLNLNHVLLKILYLSGLNMMVPMLNKEQLAMVGAKTKKPSYRLWE